MGSSNYTDKVEEVIVSLLGLIRAFFATIKDVALRPKRFARNMSDDHGDYLKPFTFLTLATFSSVTITRYALIAVVISVSAFFRDCSGETYVPTEPPTLKEVMQLPSVETLVYVALPAVLLIIIIGKLTDWLLLRQGEDRRHSIASIFLFVVGIQQLVVIPVLFGIYLGANNQRDEIFNGWILIAAAGIAILLPAFSFFRIGRTLNPPLDFRITVPWRRNITFAMVAGLSVTLSLAAILGMGFWVARKEIEVAGKDVPMIAVAYVEQVAEGPPGRPRFSALLENNGKADLWIKSKLVMELFSEEPESTKYECALIGPDLRAGLMKLPKGEVVTSLIEVQKRVDEARQRPIQFFRLTFRAMDLEGNDSSILSKVRTSDGEAADKIVRKVQEPAESAHD
jgi:hypothetical protein